MWQRTLFSLYGVDIESTTLIVTAFMLGLGLGSFGGGLLSRDPSSRLLLYFAGIEGTISVFGISSLAIFRYVGALTAGASGAVTFFITFGLVLLPTCLMGATLPLLVAFLVRSSGNVGRSVGALYFVNTIGSALAALATAVFLLGYFGQTASIGIAAGLNGIASAGIFALWWRARL